jgi:hypothetical protein
MPVTHSKSTGVEELLDQVETVLIRDINPALAEVYARREQSDIDRAERRSLPYIPMEYDEVPADHFHIGNFPSLALDEVPHDSYPYVVLTVEDLVPDAENSFQDQRNIYRESLSVHCLAKSSFEEGVDIVFRRAVRMGEAVFISLMSERTLRSNLALPNPARGRYSIPWDDSAQGHGDTFWFQACGLSFAIKSYTSMYE